MPANPLEPLEPRVWHVNDPDVPEDAIYVGRPSDFGNPIVLRREADRDLVLEQYIQYLSDNPAMVEKIKRELRGHHLKCWCAPKKCHADVLFRIANS